MVLTPAKVMVPLGLLVSRLKIGVGMVWLIVPLATNVTPALFSSAETKP